MTAPARFVANPTFLRTASRPGGFLDRQVHRTALAVQAEARRRVGVRGGSPRQYPNGDRPPNVAKGDKLRPSIKVITLGPARRSVGSNLPYARFHHDGTRPHVIRPRRPGGVLAFYSHRANALIFAKSVQHPGTKANEYLTGAARALGLHVVLHGTGQRPAA